MGGRQKSAKSPNSSRTQALAAECVQVTSPISPAQQDLCATFDRVRALIPGSPSPRPAHWRSRPRPGMTASIEACPPNHIAAALIRPVVPSLCARLRALDGPISRPYGPPAFIPSWDGSLPPSEPDDLKRLGERVDAARRKSAGPENQAAPSSPYSIAFRLGTELVSAVFVGSAMGWGIDWAFQHWAHVMTRPVGMVVMFFLGALAGIRNVYRTSQQLSANSAPKEK